MKKTGNLVGSLLLGCIAFAAGCGGGGSNSKSQSTPAQNPTLVSIAVTPGNGTVTAGATLQLTAKGTYSDNSTATLTSQVTWKVADTTIASISTAGLVTGVKAGGPVTITATQGTVSGTTGVTVTASSGGGGGGATLSSITIIPSSFSLAAQQNKQLQALGVYSDGTTLDLTSQATWSSSNSNFVSVNGTGLATGVGTGSATITAAMGSVSGSATGTVTAASLSSIVVGPSTASVAIGQTQPFSANGIFSDGSSTDMTNSVAWSSSAANIATINSTGLATGVAMGSTTIDAGSGTTIGAASLTVTSAVLTSIDISPDGQIIPIGGQYPLTLTGTYSDNTTGPITNATWTSSDTTLATVDQTGNVTGVANSGANAVTITATVGTLTNTTTVYVTDAAPKSLVLTPATASIAAGTTQLYSVSAIYSDGSIQPVTAGLSWASSSPSVAGINATTGVATGLAQGQSTITVTYDSMTATATLTVTAATLANIVVTPATPTVGINGNVQFTATGVFTDNSTQDLTSLVTWSSSAANVALISNSGVATGLSVGTTTISANYQGMSGSATLTVDSAHLVSITISPANPTVPPRTRIQLTAIGNFSDGTTEPLSGISWHTNTGRYATVSGTGVVRTKKSTNQAVPVYASLNGVTGQTSLTITSTPLASLQILPANPTIAAGTTQQFQLIGTYSGGSQTVDLTKSARWQTSSYTNAVINRNGLASGLTSGSATITGSYGNLTPATTTLTISSATISSVAVTPAAPTIALGTTQQFDAVGTFSDGTTQDITTLSQWTSSAPTVAVVNQSGLATSASDGNTNITATFNHVSNAAVPAVLTVK
jgi:uncharacterized protein YjdB